MPSSASPPRVSRTRQDRAVLTSEEDLDLARRSRAAHRYCRSRGVAGRTYVPTSHLERYLVNRYYDPATNQFLAVDPLVSLTGEPFSYANGDPVNGSDPSGLSFWSDVATVATVVAIVAVVGTVTVATAGVGDVAIVGAGGVITGSGLASAGLATAGGAASVALGADFAQGFQSSAGSFPSPVLQTRGSGKEKANDLPSWVNPEECQPQQGENTPGDVARRLVENAPAGVSRGSGPRSPLNQIKKYVSRKYFGS